MFTLNDKTKANIEKKTGIPFNDIAGMDIEEIDSRIEKKIGKKLLPDCEKIEGCKLISMDEIDKKLSDI